ncbi:PadR family transcriptional regulator [Micromonospora sp. LOL_013]|uniref:PadR family transcriptional regulator n=1 Tax=unclassified Micromonospora TaxID=2617518 RepID=UPI003A8C6C9F
MSTVHVLLGLLSRGPRHGYELKRDHDQRLPRAKPIAFGQVYATLGRMQRDGLVEQARRDRAAGPDRTSYTLTDAGRTALDGWLDAVEPPAPYVTSALLAKVVVALLIDDPQRARRYLAAQRAAHAARIRELTRTKTAPDATLGEIVAADYAINHLDADLRWLDTTVGRVADLHREVRQ